MNQPRPTRPPGSHDGIHAALIAALTAMGPVKKDQSNPAYRSKYASLESVLDTIEEPLRAAGLVFTQTFDVVGGEVLLVTTLIHAETGQEIVSRAPVRCQEPNNPQKLGGAITYMRRYSLLALLGLAPEDDDGNAASQSPKATAPKPSAPTAQPAKPTDAARPTTWNEFWAWARPHGFARREQILTVIPEFEPVTDPAEGKRVVEAFLATVEAGEG